MNTPRVLSISPGTRQLGYAYFEGAELIEWGIRENTRGEIPERVTTTGLKHVRALVKRYEPEVLLLPATERRKPNQEKFAEAIQAELHGDDLVVERISRYDVRDCFARLTHTEKPTKQAVMVELARLFPELGRLVPKARRVWDSQDYWTPMFDAAVRAVTWITKSS